MLAVERAVPTRSCSTSAPARRGDPGPEAKLTNDRFLNVPWGIGIRKGDAALQVGERGTNLMRKRAQFTPILKHNAPARFVSAFSTTSRDRATVQLHRSADTDRGLPVEAHPARARAAARGRGRS